jgi:hypothetical protein
VKGVSILNYEHQRHTIYLASLSVCSTRREADMAEKIWQVEKIKNCEHVGHEVTIENEVVYPAEHLPDQPARIIAHRCSNVLECNMLEKPTCALCGTNPDLDPV